MTCGRIMPGSSGTGRKGGRGPFACFGGGFLKLPHVTIEYVEEESAGVGKISVPLITGLGLHWAWVFSAMFSAGELFSFAFAGMAQIMTTVSMAAMALTLMCYTLLTKQIRPYFRTRDDRRRVRLLAAIAASAGLLCVALGALSGSQLLGGLCCFVGGVASGVGSAALLMSYGVSFSVCDTAASAMQFALSCIVTCLVYALIMVANASMHPLGVALCIAVPIFELLCLNVSSSQLVDRTEFADTTMPIYTGRFSLRIAPSALAFGFLFGFLGMHAFRDVSELAIDASSFVWSVSAAGVIVCALVVCVMLTMRQRANYAFRALNPVIALVIALVTHLVASGVTTVVHCLFLVSYMLIEACLWISYSDMSQKFRISPFHVYGMGRGLVGAGAALATVLMLPSSALHDSLVSIDTILPVALILLVFGSSTYPRDAEAVDVLKRGNCCPAFFDPFDPNNESMKTMVEGQAEARQEEAGEGASSAASSQVVVELAETQAEAASQEAVRQAEPRLDRGGMGAACAAGSPESATIVAPEPAPPSASSQAALAQDDQEQEEERVGRYKRRCLALANMCLLSRRETEVLFLLAKGYNTKMIQEQLFISAGTANTHMRHVYRKLDVHSQQDLIRMVDSIEVEDEDW